MLSQPENGWKNISLHVEILQIAASRVLDQTDVIRAFKGKLGGRPWESRRDVSLAKDSHAVVAQSLEFKRDLRTFGLLGSVVQKTLPSTDSIHSAFRIGAARRRAAPHTPAANSPRNLTNPLSL